MTTYRVLALLTLAVGAMGCSGEDGATGPAGPLPAVAVGGGLTGTGEAATPLAVDFGAGGSAATVARSDHGHSALEGMVAAHDTAITTLGTTVQALEVRVPNVPGSATVEMSPFSNDWTHYASGDIILSGWDDARTYKVTLTTGNWLVAGAVQVSTTDVPDAVKLSLHDLTEGNDFAQGPGGITTVGTFRQVSVVGFLQVGATPKDVTLAVGRNGASSLRIVSAAHVPGAVLRAIRIN